MKRQLFGLAAATALLLGVSVASADEVTGAISKIDLTANTFEVEGKVFAASPENTVGVKLDELQDGDKVKVGYANPQGGQMGKSINAMTLEKVE